MAQMSRVAGSETTTMPITAGGPHHTTVELDGTYEPNWGTVLLQESMERRSVQPPPGGVVVRPPQDPSAVPPMLDAEWFSPADEQQVVAWIDQLVGHANIVVP